MPSNTPLTDAINALTQYANETTGQSDTTLSDAVGTLVAGYGGGGGGWTTDGIAGGTEPNGAITITVPTIAANAFKNKKGITSVTATSTSVQGEAFRECSNITSVSLPNVTTMTGASQFQSCVKMTAFSAPELTAVSGSMLNDCELLTSVNIPKATDIGGNSFQQCYALEFLDLPKVTHIGGTAFFNARKLSTLILRHTAVVPLGSANALNNTPMAGYNGLSGTVYVPQSLISSYQTASVWSTLYSGGHCTFAAIEGSQYE